LLVLYSCELSHCRRPPYRSSQTDRWGRTHPSVKVKRYLVGTYYREGFQVGWKKRKMPRTSSSHLISSRAQLTCGAGNTWGPSSRYVVPRSRGWRSAAAAELECNDEQHEFPTSRFAWTVLIKGRRVGARSCWLPAYSTTTKRYKW
jgi:hypothetical protein